MWPPVHFARGEHYTTAVLQKACCTHAHAHWQMKLLTIGLPLMVLVLMGKAYNTLEAQTNRMQEQTQALQERVEASLSARVQHLSAD